MPAAHVYNTDLMCTTPIYVFFYSLLFCIHDPLVVNVHIILQDISNLLSLISSIKVKS